LKLYIAESHLNTSRINQPTQIFDAENFPAPLSKTNIGHPG